jgi:Ca2+/Na+ antiporter
VALKYSGTEVPLPVGSLDIFGVSLDTGWGMVELFGDEHFAAIALLFGGALGMLIAILAGVGVVLRPAVTSPGYRALTHWMPMAVAAVVCAGLGHPEMGIGIALGTSVAVLSSVVGFVGLAGTMETIPARAGRLWALLPVATLLTFAVGFQGNVGPFEALMLAAEGTLVLSVWVDERTHGGWAGDAKQEITRGREGTLWGWRVSQYIVALSLAGVAAWAATRGAEQLSRYDLRYSTNALAATLLSVALALPMVGTGMGLAGEGRTWVSLTAQVGVVFLNLCVLLPIVILIPEIAHWVAAKGMAAAATQPMWQPVVFPRLNWRLDSLATVILSLMFFAMSSGRLKLDRRLAGGLIMGYCAYLMAMLVADMRG